MDGEVAGKVGVDEGGRVPLVFKVAHGRVGEGKVVCGGGQRHGEKTVQKRDYSISTTCCVGVEPGWDACVGRG